MDLKECKCGKTFNRERQYKVNNDLCDDCRKKINEKNRLRKLKYARKRYTGNDQRTEKYSKFIEKAIK